MRHIVLWSLCSLVLLADAVSWRGDYDKAHQEALKSQKPLLVLVAKPDDTHTNKIIRDVFMDQSSVKQINTQTVPVIITYGRADYPVEMYYTTVFPTLFIVDSSCEVFLHEPLYGRQITVDAIRDILCLD